MSPPLRESLQAGKKVAMAAFRTAVKKAARAIVGKADKGQCEGFCSFSGIAASILQHLHLVFYEEGPGMTASSGEIGGQRFNVGSS